MKSTWITEETKKKIHRLYKEGVYQDALAERFGLDPSYVSMIIKDQEKKNV